MEERAREDKVAEICELLALWSDLKGTHWPEVKAVLEERINYLASEFYDHNGTSWRVLQRTHPGLQVERYSAP